VLDDAFTYFHVEKGQMCQVWRKVNFCHRHDRQSYEKESIRSVSAEISHSEVNPTSAEEQHMTYYTVLLFIE